MALIQPLTQNCHQPPYQTPNVYSATPKIQLPNRQFAIIRIDARKNKKKRERESQQLTCNRGVIKFGIK